MSLNNSRLHINRNAKKALLCRMAWHWCIALLAVAALAVLAHFFRTAIVRPEVSFVDRCAEALRENALLLAMLVCLVPIFLRDTVRATHRVVGPLENITAALDELACGKIPEPVDTHKAKHWEDLADSVNRTAERIRQLESRHLPAEPSPEHSETPACV